MFIDEVHRLTKKVMDGLLKMSEPSDGLFEVGHNRVDCRRIAIICATTDPGKLTDITFAKSRLQSKRWRTEACTIDQVGQIIDF